MKCFLYVFYVVYCPIEFNFSRHTIKNLVGEKLVSPSVR